MRGRWRVFGSKLASVFLIPMHRSYPYNPEVVENDEIESSIHLARHAGHGIWLRR
jgi:hypothetical protein